MMTTSFLGEGLMQSEPIQVPVIPVSRVLRVHVREGERVTKGQLLAELDTTVAELRIAEAQAVLESAEAAEQRTALGTDYQMSQERPGLSNIRAKAARHEAVVRSKLGKMLDELADDQMVSKAEMLENDIQRVQALARMHEAKLHLKLSEQGREHSLLIASANVKSARIALKHAEQALIEHEVRAPADGIVERCVIHEGEYNQTAGKPAFLLASGLWFEAHFDQTTIGQLHVGDRAMVRCEAFAERELSGRITEKCDIVSYNRGGPETTRPIRPMGTGAPEWPATYVVRIELDDLPPDVVPGLTGFARAKVERRVLAVPRAAVIGATGHRGFVYLPTGDTFAAHDVVVGRTSEGWTEIRSGLQPGDELIVDGHQVLQSGDRIAVVDKSIPAGGSTPQVASK